MKKRIFSLVLALCMVLTFAPFGASAAVAADLDDAETYQARFKSEIESEAGLTWKTLQLAVLNYNLSNEYVDTLEGGDVKAAAQARVDMLTTYYDSITSLDMSGKDIANAYSPDLGALVILTNLKTLDVSGTGLAEFGALENLNKLETLNASNTSFDDEDFGALVNLSNLKTLDISDTSITMIETIWDDTASIYPNLTTLNAKNLNLTSISGLAEIVQAEDFNADDLVWDFTDSVLADTLANAENIVLITNAFKNTTGIFVAPSCDSKAFDLIDAEKYQSKFKSEIESEAGLTWKTLQLTVLNYNLAREYVGTLEDGEIKAAAQARVDALTTYYDSITSLDMSGKDIAGAYSPDLGALVILTNLKRLDVSGTGLAEFGALENLSKLEALNASNTRFDNEDFGALKNLTVLTALDISDTAVTKLECTVEDSEWTGMNILPRLTELTAQNLTLASISGLMEIAEMNKNDADFFKNIKWDLAGSACQVQKDADTKVYFVSGIASYFKNAGAANNFTAPYVERETFVVTIMDGSAVLTTLPVAAGDTVDSADIRKENHGFGGLYTDSAMTIAYTNTPVYEDITMYSKWTLNTYTITTITAINGTATADKDTAAMGETVTLTLTPNESYKLDTLIVTDAEGNVLTVRDNSFTMPAGNVTIIATFKLESPVIEITTISEEQGGGVGYVRTISLKADDGFNGEYVVIQLTSGTGIDAVVNVVMVKAENTVKVSYKNANTAVQVWVTSNMPNFKTPANLGVQIYDYAFSN